MGDILGPCIQACNGSWCPSHSAGIYWFHDKYIFYIKFIPHLQTNVQELWMCQIWSGILYCTSWKIICLIFERVEFGWKACCTKGCCWATKRVTAKCGKDILGDFYHQPANPPDILFPRQTLYFAANSSFYFFTFFSCPDWDSSTTQSVSQNSKLYYLTCKHPQRAILETCAIWDIWSKHFLLMWHFCCNVKLL